MTGTYVPATPGGAASEIRKHADSGIEASMRAALANLEPGKRGGCCMKPACRFRTPAFTSTTRTSCRSRTCRDSRQGTRRGSRSSCTAVAAVTKIESALSDKDLRAAVLALRVAVLVHHARADIAVPRIRVAVGKRVRFAIGTRWLAARPLSAYLLAKERAQWESLGYAWRAWDR